MTKRESQETRIALLENNHKNVMEKFDDMFERFDKLEEKLDKALKGKSDIWVERAFTWVIYTVAGILITALMYLIINK